MQEPQDGEESPRKTGKVESSLIDAAYLLLANKLYGDYLDAFGSFQGSFQRPWMEPEAESFAEHWMKKRIPNSDQTMTRAVWRHFLCLLVEYRGNE